MAYAWQLASHRVVTDDRVDKASFFWLTFLTPVLVTLRGCLFEEGDGDWKKENEEKKFWSKRDP